MADYRHAPGTLPNSTEVFSSSTSSYSFALSASPTNGLPTQHLRRDYILILLHLLDQKRGDLVCGLSTAYAIPV